MNEVLFRGKGINDNKFTFGYLVKEYEDYFILKREKRLGFGMLVYYENVKIQVYLETISQYTNVNDSKKEKLFKDDIVKCTKSNKLYYIDKVYGGFVLINLEYYGQDYNELIAEPMSSPQVVWYIKESMVKIGNLHENEELISGV